MPSGRMEDGRVIRWLSSIISMCAAGYSRRCFTVMKWLSSPWDSLRRFFFFFSSFLSSKTRVLQGLLNCGAHKVCLRESDLVRSLGEGKKKKKHSQIPERVSFPFCRIIPRHAWTLHLDPSYLCDHSLSFLFVSPPASVEYVKQTYCKLICDNNGVFCWRSTNSQAVCVSTFLPWIAWSCRRQGRKRG